MRERERREYILAQFNSEREREKISEREREREKREKRVQREERSLAQFSSP